MAMLDHLIVPSHDRKGSAKFLADLLNVKAGDSFGVFSAVYVNDTLTIDFMQSDEFDVHHYCFSVTEEEFDAILARLQNRKIPYRSSPHGPMDMQINTANGGRNLYWFDPDGHNWEILTVSYARPARNLSGVSSSPSIDK
jgi:catechol 2,3-dioxygenase-like lactoylglutathione lyase family enzyme